jgi:hypothetical protein
MIVQQQSLMDEESMQQSSSLETDIDKLAARIYYDKHTAALQQAAISIHYTNSMRSERLSTQEKP